MCLTNMQIAVLATPLDVGNVRLPNRVFLAPMSGVSDKPFRILASRFGAGLVVSEMVASEQLVEGHPETVMRAERTGEGPHVIQLAGREAHWMAEGARAATDAGADIIDINMGCPAKKVTNGYSGSALMRDLDHALSLIEATVAATPLPVTLKMRLGWDRASLNAPQLARRAEAAGVRLVTVHGRTRCQFYDGAADWAAIRAVKEAVSIPVIANGDVTGPADLERVLALSGADGVMLGRGAYGRPWLPGQLAAFAATGSVPIAPAGDVLADLVLGHYEAMLAHYGTPLGLRVARKHLGWYMAAAGAGSAASRGAILTSNSPDQVKALLRRLFADADAELRSAA
ncbi:MAG TPA: tRNA dihydrouridine synthase DusB [Bauldia sp.]|nr:tRNA dihydrouridine synthase DusB [Bauldia sp.]